jgi:glycosyltransferase involved in cell wall biosynthesis
VGPLVTVGIPAFNAENTIVRAVESAVAQQWRPIEIVVVDDCSSDRTFDQLAALAVRYPELRIFRHDTNEGVAATRNRIVTEARGDFLAFFDDDDESLPERVEVQLARITQYELDFANGAAVICHTARLIFYPHGSRRIAPTMGEQEGRPAPAGLPVVERILLGKRLRYGYGACPTCSQMARLSTYRAVGGFDPALRRCEDSDFNIRLAMRGGHFVGVAQPLVLQSMTKGSEKTLSEEYRHLVALINKHRGLIDRAGQFEFCRDWVHAKQAWLEGRLGRFVRTMASLAFFHPLLTVNRLFLAVPNLGLNTAFRHFHLRDKP